MKMDHAILDTIETKRLIWYSHRQRLAENQWLKIWQQTPAERRKHGRPLWWWKDNVKDDMAPKGRLARPRKYESWEAINNVLTLGIYKIMYIIHRKMH